MEFYRGLQEGGRSIEEELAPVLSLSKPFSIHGARGELVLALPAEKSTYQYGIHYEHPMIGYQSVSFSPESQDYETQIAPARTFALWEEVKPLLERGMAQGGNLENALIIYQDKFSSALKMEMEPAHHKCLDLIGDFALLGARVKAHIIAIKAGHQLHIDCAKLIWQERREYEHTGN